MLSVKSDMGMAAIQRYINKKAMLPKEHCLLRNTDSNDPIFLFG